MKRSELEKIIGQPVEIWNKSQRYAATRVFGTLVGTEYDKPRYFTEFTAEQPRPVPGSKRPTHALVLVEKVVYLSGVESYKSARGKFTLAPYAHVHPVEGSIRSTIAAIRKERRAQDEREAEKERERAANRDECRRLAERLNEFIDLPGGFVPGTTHGLRASISGPLDAVRRLIEELEARGVVI